MSVLPAGPRLPGRGRGGGPPVQAARAGLRPGLPGRGHDHRPVGRRRASRTWRASSTSPSSAWCCLLFLIGLELQPSRLWELRKSVFGLGGLQVVGSGLLLAGVGLLLGLSRSTALIAGLGLSLSSTAFALQLLAEKNELTTEYGRASLRHPPVPGPGRHPAAGPAARCWAPRTSPSTEPGVALRPQGRGRAGGRRRSRAATCCAPCSRWWPRSTARSCSPPPRCCSSWAPRRW